MKRLFFKNRSIKDKNFLCISYDLQKVLPVPKAEVSQMYYKRKLAVYNFTVFNLGNKSGDCFMWHEGIAKRGANEIASSVYSYIIDEARNNNTREVTIYSDNCMGQNKNSAVALMYAKVVATIPTIDVITHKFLEKGHTENEGDSMHSVIEKSIGKIPVYIPHQYYTLVRSAKKKRKALHSA